MAYEELILEEVVCLISYLIKRIKRLRKKLFDEKKFYSVVSFTDVFIK
ncbi:MAG: hypothetical protein ACLSBN_01025 [Clostridium perfringens]